MAIIKPIKWRGFTPYWWEITQLTYDPLSNQTYIQMGCFPDSEAYAKDKSSRIPDVIYQTALSGFVTDFSDAVDQIMEKERNGFFTGGSNVGNDYTIQDHPSPIIVNISNDPIERLDENGELKPVLTRKAECTSYKFMLRNDIMLLALRIHFYESDIVLPELEKDVLLVIDNFDKMPNGVGHYDHFNNLRIANRMLDEEILTTGIQFADQVGAINKKLYGINI